VRDWTGGRGADLACDFVGFPPVVPEGIEMLRYGGTYLEIGCISRGRTVEFDPSYACGVEAIVGVVMYDRGVIRAPRVRSARGAASRSTGSVSHTFRSTGSTTPSARRSGTSAKARRAGSPAPR
jgi:hypothetical protein